MNLMMSRNLFCTNKLNVFCIYFLENLIFMIFIIFPDKSGSNCALFGNNLKLFYIKRIKEHNVEYGGNSCLYFFCCCPKLESFCPIIIEFIYFIS